MNFSGYYFYFFYIKNCSNKLIKFESLNSMYIKVDECHEVVNLRYKYNHHQTQTTNEHRPYRNTLAINERKYYDKIIMQVVTEIILFPFRVIHALAKLIATHLHT